MLELELFIEIARHVISLYDSKASSRDIKFRKLNVKPSNMGRFRGHAMLMSLKYGKRRYYILFLQIGVDSEAKCWCWVFIVYVQTICLRPIIRQLRQLKCVHSISTAICASWISVALNLYISLEQDWFMSAIIGRTLKCWRAFEEQKPWKTFRRFQKVRIFEAKFIKVINSSCASLCQESHTRSPRVV